MVLQSVLVIASDLDPLARFNSASLPPQTIIELLCDSFDEKSYFRDRNGDYKALSDIDGISLDDDENVDIIDFYYKTIKGTLDVEYLPSTLMWLDIPGNKFEGTLDTSKFPASLTLLRANDNCFTGSLVLTKLPSELQFIAVRANKLTGNLDFSRISEYLLVLDIHGNEFNGELDLRPVDRFLQTGNTEGIFYSLWQNAEPKIEDGGLMVDFSRNNFSGDVLVRDLLDIRDGDMFESLKCERITDPAGNSERIKGFRLS